MLRVGDLQSSQCLFYNLINMKKILFITLIPFTLLCLIAMFSYIFTGYNILEDLSSTWYNIINLTLGLPIAITVVGLILWTAYKKLFT